MLRPSRLLRRTLGRTLRQTLGQTLGGIVRLLASKLGIARKAVLVILAAVAALVGLGLFVLALALLGG